jgi:diguanylate cyclase (GGDEF)-like protein
MSDPDPMSEALASLAGEVQPRRSKSGAIKYQPPSDWSLDRLPEIQSRFKQTQGRDLPVKVRGQGAIHDRWGYDHHDSADISLNPDSSEGQALMAQLREQRVPFLAFDHAIPGVATGPHIHIGHPSTRIGQSLQANASDDGDPMAEALSSLKGVAPQEAAPLLTPQVTSRVVDDTGEEIPPSAFKPLGFQEAQFPQQDRRLAGIEELTARKYREAPAPSQNLGPIVTAKLPANKGGSPDAIAEAVLSVYGPQYVDLNALYKQATGRNLIQVNDAKIDREGNFNFAPSKHAIDFVNAFAQGTSEGGVQEGLKRAAEVNRQAAAEQTSAYQAAQTAAAPDIREAEAGLKRAKDSPVLRGMIGGVAPVAQQFGTVIPGHLGDELQRQAVVERAISQQADIDQPLTTTGEQIKAGLGAAVPTAMNLAVTAPLRAAQLPALGALQGTTLEERLQGAAQGAVMQGAFAGIPKAFSDLPKTGTAVASGTMVGLPAIEAWQRGESPVKAIAENLPFAALPLMHGGRAGERGADNAESSLRLQRSPETSGERAPQPEPQRFYHRDPMAEALAEAKIHRAEEPYAGPPEFRGMAEGDLYDLASRRPSKGTSRQKRLELIRSQAAAIAEIDRRQNEGQPAEIVPPDTGIRADTGNVPSFQDYVENRPGGGLRFETLEPGSRDFNQLAGEYVERYGSRPRPVRPQPPETAARTTAGEQIVTAAIRNPDGSVTTGKNHPQILLSQGKQVAKDRSGPEYGFVTSTGRFVSREEAAQIAGVPNTIKQGSLYTEDLTAAKKNLVQSPETATTPAMPPVAAAGSGTQRSSVTETIDTGRRPTAEMATVDVAAHDAATSPHNNYPEPTEAQTIAGNYRKGHVTVAGMDLAIENPQGSERSGVDPNGKKWSITMQSHYGYLKRSESADGEAVDAYVRPGIKPEYDGPIFVVNQTKGNGHFDEHKVMVGWPDEAQARAAYLENYTRGWDRIHSIARFENPEAFKQWLKDGDTTRPASPPSQPQPSDRRQRQVQALRGERRALKQERRDLQRQAETDDLTGLANQRAWNKALPAAERDPSLTILTGDINNMKAVNDSQGHDAGDALIKKAADAFRQAAKESGETRVFRSGIGDEISAIVPKEKAERIRARAEKIFGESSVGDRKVSLSVGAGPDFATAETNLGPRKKAAKGLPQIEPRTVGRESQAVTERGSEINTRYAVVDLDSLITSHDSALRVNPDFPPELQPRERDRAASADQISRIASNLRPEFLGESPKASEGAPIVGPDGIVESGNGRVLALRQAYESKNKGLAAYQRYLASNAERLGLDLSAIKRARSPILVRIRTTKVDRSQFVKEANEQSIASMSPVEQARSDATSLKAGLLDLFRPSESGEIATSANMNFVRAFMKDVVGPNEVNRYVTATGQLSQEGVARIRNAIFARAYGDSPGGLLALEKLAESPDNNVRNITTAMLRNAPGFASLKDAIDRGVRYQLDAAPDVAAAMSKMSALRESGTPVPDYLKQGALYGEELTPLQKRLLQVFDQNKRGANTINAILENYLKGAEAAGDPRQAGMFGSEIPGKADLLEAAILEAVHGQGIQTDLFTSQQHQGLPAETSSGSNLSEVNPRELARPRLAETTDAAGSTEGRPLGRFDSAIDRLKAQEEAARQRLTERGTEFQKLLDEKGPELGATTIPQDLYDYVVIGASKLAQRSLNAAQFVDEMVREFGESIRKHARAIFKLSQKMVADTQTEVRAERLSKEIADRLFTENLPKDMQREALRIAAQFRTSTDTQGRFLSGFKSRVGEMARSYGAAGGELTNRVHLGDIARGHEMEAGNKYLSKIQDVYGEIKNDFERHRISDSVIKALEDRANAERHLDTPEKKAVYENTVEMLDMFRAKLKALGYETRDDYFTHIRDVDILDQIISDAKDPKDTSLNELVAANSRFLKPRIDAKMEIKKDLPRVLYAYVKSVSKEIAYSDAVEYYYDHFLDDIPIGLRKNSMDRAITLMQNSLKPEQGRGRFFRTVGQLRSQQYRNFLAYNLKASAQNFTQVDFARLRWTKEAAKLTGKVWRDRKAITGALADAIDIASTKETPLMRFLEQFKGDDPSGTQGRFAETFNKYDPFQRSEGRNWAMTELGSIVNSVVKRPEYKELKAKLGAEAAINKLLEKQDVFDAAAREAATTAAETQVAANPAMRGEFYDAPLHRIIGMFTAFKTRQLQVLAEALGKQTGVDGARAQVILRRGLSGDAQPVEVLREIQAQRVAMETMMKRAAKFNEDIGIPHDSLRTMLRHLRGQETDLNEIIKRLEPLSGGRRRAVVLTAKYFAKVGAISVFFNLFWDSVYSGLYGDDDKDGEERVSTALKRAFWDILPSPFYGADPSKFLVSPVAPNFERSAPFGHVTKRGVVRDVVSYGTSVIPFAGVVDRATNRRLSGALVDVVAPKKEREKRTSP